MIAPTSSVCPYASHRLAPQTCHSAAVSCGAYGYPVEEAAQIAAKTTQEFLAKADRLEKVIFVLWGKEIYDAYRQLV